MAFSGMSCRVALVRTDVLEERRASIIRFTRTDCHPDDGGTTFLRNIGYYTSHTA
jgi:hypothetical protein